MRVNDDHDSVDLGPRLADPSESVERLTDDFDTHLTPNAPNFADFGRHKRRVERSQNRKLGSKHRQAARCDWHKLTRGTVS